MPAAWVVLISLSPGGAEHPFFPEYAKELAEAGGASASYKIVPGSDHFYHGHETEVIDILSDWLKQFKHLTYPSEQLAFASNELPNRNLHIQNRR